jgi:acyl transferase domain-containing protein
MLKAVLALQHKVLPPTIKVRRPNPALDIDNSPLYLNTHARPWVRDSTHPRRASVSSFGFGGTNFHVTLEEYVPRSGGEALPRLRAMPAELVLLSAPTAAELVDRARGFGGDSGDALSHIAWETHQTFRHDDHVRLAVVATDAGDLVGKLTQAAIRIEQDPAASFAMPGGVHY